MAENREPSACTPPPFEMAYAATTRRVLVKLLICRGELDRAYALALKAVEASRKSGNQRAVASPLAVAAEAAVALGRHKEAWAHLVALEPVAHYLWRPHSQLRLRILRARVQHQMGVEIGAELPQLDEDILGFEAALYRGRYAWKRSLLAKELGDATGEARWLEHAKSAKSELQGGCPLDLKHLG